MMEFKIKDKSRPLPKGYTEREMSSARIILQELATRLPYVKAGLLSRITANKTSPLYIYLDDLSHHLSQGVINEYVKVAAGIIHKHQAKFDLHPIKLSQHWDHFSKKDKEYLHIIRFGIIVYDQGFLEPVATLLAEGRIRPSKEAMAVYYGRTGITLRNANQHVLQAAVDLYWAAMDAAHAAVMCTGKTPPAPADMPKELEQTFVHRKMLETKYPWILQRLYELHKHIEHRQVVTLTGTEWDALLKDTQSFVSRMKKLIQAQGV